MIDNPTGSLDYPRWLLLLTLLLGATASVTAAEPDRPARYTSELIFPLHPQHNHAPGIVELSGGDLLVSWYRGSGERQADDVAVWGACKRSGEPNWSQPFVMVDTPGFPDGNTCMWVDPQQRIWLFWPLVLANTWESCLTQFAVARDTTPDGAPIWDRQGTIWLKPDDFGPRAEDLLQQWLVERSAPLTEEMQSELRAARDRLHDKLYQRLGWQPRCKPTLVTGDRLLLPLYSDTYSISIMAISDDFGGTWRASEPLIGFGNIQPSVLERSDGTLVAYMRENGPRDRIRVCESTDRGESWGPVGTIDLPNPGSGLDAVRLASGAWLLVYNDTVSGRNSLAVSLSTDEGKSWPWTRHLERQAEGSYHYPAVIQGADGTIHVVYSYFVPGGKSMKHAALREAWIQGE